MAAYNSGYKGVKYFNTYYISEERINFFQIHENLS